MTYQVTLWNADKNVYSASVNRSQLIALYFIDVDLNFSNSFFKSELLVVKDDKKYEKDNLLVEMFADNTTYTPITINYYQVNLLKHQYGVFVGYGENLYYLYSFDKQDCINDYVKMCLKFNVDPRKYIYGPAFDKQRNLYHINDVNTKYQGYEYWPRLENTYYDDIHPVSGLPSLYPISEDEQEVYSEENALPSKASVNYRSLNNDWQEALKEDNLLPHRGPGANKNSVSYSDYEEPYEQDQQPSLDD
jgi:hypothetical protein